MIGSVQPVWLVVCFGLLIYLLHNLVHESKSMLCMTKAVSRQSDLQKTKSIDAGFCTHLHDGGFPNKLVNGLAETWVALKFSSFINKNSYVYEQAE